jgi:plasmid stabilization system protein ParE
MASKPVYIIIISSRAQKEISQAWNWYEDRQQGLGDRFVAAVTKRLRKIELHPELYPLRHKTYRETLVPIFPYLILYRIKKQKKSVRIVSIFHTSLNPKTKPK